MAKTVLMLFVKGIRFVGVPARLIPHEYLLGNLVGFGANRFDSCVKRTLVLESLSIASKLPTTEYSYVDYDT